LPVEEVAAVLLLVILVGVGELVDIALRLELRVVAERLSRN
jgi:hypothetical protein